MRSIHAVKLDKTRPALILTREIVIPRLTRITVAPISSTIRGLSTEVPVGRQNGLHRESVISCDNITTVDAADVGRPIGFLLDDQEPELAEAIRAAFDLL